MLRNFGCAPSISLCVWTFRIELFVVVKEIVNELKPDRGEVLWSQNSISHCHSGLVSLNQLEQSRASPIRLSTRAIIVQKGSLLYIGAVTATSALYIAEIKIVKVRKIFSKLKQLCYAWQNPLIIDELHHLLRKHAVWQRH